jgi:hypothetical protein
MPIELPKTLDRIKRDIVEEGECWIWTGSLGGRSKVPQIKIGGRAGTVMAVRRLVACIKLGRWLESHEYVSNTCGEKNCVNPDHVKITTPKQKAKLAAERGAFSRPDRAAKVIASRVNQKASDEVIQQVRNAPTAAEAARITGLSRGYCARIRSGQNRSVAGNPWAGLMR